MALSGTITGSTSNQYIDSKIIWSATQSISGNYSTVTATLYYSRNNSGYTTRGTWTGSITINGVTTTGDSKYITITEDSNTVAMTCTQKVNHNADGTKTITISASGKISGTTLESTSLSKSITLNTIPRASSFSLSTSSVNVGSTITANISRASSSFTHTVEWYINSSYKTTYEGVGTSKSFTIPTSWYNAMPSSTSCTAYCRVTTYNGGTKIGSSVSKTFTVKVPSSIKPSIGNFTLTAKSFSISTPSGTSTVSLLVQGKNSLTVAASSCKAGTGSTIKSYTFSGPSLSKTVSTTSTSQSTSISSVNTTGTLTYKVTVTDTRGRSTTVSKTIKCYEYSSPTFSSFKAYRATSSGTANANGTYIKCTYSTQYASVNSTNGIYRVRAFYAVGEVDEGSGTALGANGSVLINLNGNTTNTYQVQLEITDYYGNTSLSNIRTVYGSFRSVNITKDGTGIALGKMAESNQLFECRWPVKFNGLLTSTGGIKTEADGESNKYFEARRTNPPSATDNAHKNIKMQMYIGDAGYPTIRNQYSLDDGETWTTRSTLRLQDDGVYCSDSVHAMEGYFGEVASAKRGRFWGSSDAKPDELNDVPLRIGEDTAEHLDIDNNEIMAKDNASTLGTLGLAGASIDSYVGNVLTLKIGSDETGTYVRSEPTYSRTYAGSPNMYITSNGVFGRGTSSSQRYKTDIEDVKDETLNPYNILNIPVRQYRYNADNVPINKNIDDLYIGCIAEEVAKAYPIAAEYNEDGQVEMWNIKIIVPAMLKIIQDQQKEIKALRAEVDNMKNIQ